MLKSKNIRSRLITTAIAAVLILSQTLSVFADDILPETEELPVQTEPAMWGSEVGVKWCTVASAAGEDSEIYVDEVPHSSYRAYHTIGYALFLSEEEKASNRGFYAGSIDRTIKPLFYFPTEGDDGEFKVDGRTYTSRKYINLEEVGKMFERKNPDINPYTRRLFLSPIVTYRYYASIGTKAEYKPDNYEDYADLVMQLKRDDNDIYTLEDVLEEIDHFYTCHATQFDAIAKKVGGNTWSQLRPNAVFYTDLVGHLGFEDVTIDGEAVFAPYNKCKITSLSGDNQGKSIQSFAPGQTIPIIEPEEIEPEGPSDPGPLPILTYTSFPANNADGKSGDPIPDSAIAINGEYYFANKAEQPEYDWSEKGGGYIPVTENITAYVKADNWIGSSQFAQCHDMAVFRVYFEIKYTKVRHTTRNGKRHTNNVDWTGIGHSDLLPG